MKVDYNSELNFRANFIMPVKIQKLNRNKQAEDIIASFVELDCAKDFNSVKELVSLWSANGNNFTSAIIFNMGLQDAVQKKNKNFSESDNCEKSFFMQLRNKKTIFQSLITKKSSELCRFQITKNNLHI